MSTMTAAQAAQLSAFTLGKDMSLSIQVINLLGASSSTPSKTNPYSVDDIGILESWDVKPIQKMITKIPVNYGGQPIHRQVVSGWQMSAVITRIGPQVDYLAQALQDAYYNQGGSVLATVTHNIINPTGAASGENSWQYQNCVMTVQDLGMYRGEEAVSQRIEFLSPVRVLASDTTQPSSMSAELAQIIAALSAVNF